jgi:GT2 family glycosyltransferase
VETETRTVREIPRVSVIVVLFNSAEYIEACIGSLAAVTYPDLEVIIVDNGSADSSAELARRVADRQGLACSISVLRDNSGFARANNHGFGLATGEIILLVNPDAELFPDAVDALVDAFEEPSVGVCGCKLYYPDRKTLQHTGGYVRDNGLSMHYGVDEPDEGQYEEMRDCAYVTGAALGVRRDLFERVGMLDPGYYPAYFEETELCLSARRLGHRVVYVPGARVVHHEATTTGKFSERYYYLYHKNRIRFLLKNFSWSFLLNRSLPMEERWLGMIEAWEQAVPLNKAYLVNLASLPRILLARRKLERLLRAPRLEDTVSHFE